MTGVHELSPRMRFTDPSEPIHALCNGTTCGVIVAQPAIVAPLPKLRNLTPFVGVWDSHAF